MDNPRQPFNCLLVKKTPGWFLVPLKAALQRVSGEPGPILPIPWITGGENDHNLGYVVLLATGATFFALLADCACRYLRTRSKSDKTTTTLQCGVNRELKLLARYAPGQRKGASGQGSKTSSSQVTTTVTSSTKTEARQRSKKKRGGNKQETTSLLPGQGASSGTNQSSDGSPDDEGIHSLDPSPSTEVARGGFASAGKKKTTATTSKTDITTTSMLKVKKSQDKKKESTDAQASSQGTNKNEQVGQKSSVLMAPVRKVEVRSKHVQVNEPRQPTSDRGSSPVRQKTNAISKNVQTDTEKAKLTAEGGRKTGQSKSSTSLEHRTMEKKVSMSDRGCSPIRSLLDLSKELAILYPPPKETVHKTTAAAPAARPGGQDLHHESASKHAATKSMQSKINQSVKVTSTSVTHTFSKNGSHSYADVARGGQSMPMTEEEVLYKAESLTKQTPSLSFSGSDSSEQFEMIDAASCKTTQTDITGNQYVFNFSATALGNNEPWIGLQVQDQSSDDASKSKSDSGVGSSQFAINYPGQEGYVNILVSNSDQHKDTQTDLVEDVKDGQVKDVKSVDKKSEDHKFTQTLQNEKQQMTQTEKHDEHKVTQTGYSEESKDTQTEKKEDTKPTQTAYSDESKDTQTDKNGDHKITQTIQNKLEDTNTQTEKSDESKITQTTLELERKEGENKDTQTAVIDQHQMIQTEQNNDHKVTQTLVKEDHRQTQTEKAEEEKKIGEHKDTQTEKEASNANKKEAAKKPIKHKQIQTKPDDAHKEAQTDSKQIKQKKTQTDGNGKTGDEHPTQTDLGMSEITKLIISSQQPKQAPGTKESTQTDLVMSEISQKTPVSKESTQTDLVMSEISQKTPVSKESTQTDLVMSEIVKLITTAQMSERTPGTKESTQTDLVMSEIVKIIGAAKDTEKTEAAKDAKDTETEQTSKEGKGKSRKDKKRKNGSAADASQEKTSAGTGVATSPEKPNQSEMQVQTEPMADVTDGNSTAKGLLEDIMVALKAEVTNQYEDIREDDMEALNKDSLEQIKSLQDACSNLAREVDRIGVNLVTESVEESLNPTNPKTDVLHDRKDVLEDLQHELQTYQNSWLGVRRLLLCVDAHLRNAAMYQMFHRQVDSLESTMEQFMEYLRQKLATSRDPERQVEQFDPTALSKLANECQLTESQLKSWGNLISEISQTSKNVPPVHMRTEELSEPVPVKSLCNFSSNNVHVKEGDVMILTDNSDQSRWKLETLTGASVEMPAICCVILPPDLNTMKAAGRLETQHKEIGEKARATYSEEITKVYTVLTKHITEKETQGISQHAKQALIQNLDAFTAQGFMSEDPKLAQQMEDIRKKVDTIKEVSPKQSKKGKKSGQDSEQVSSTVEALVTMTKFLKSSKEEAERRKNMVLQGLLLESEETAWEEVAAQEAPEEVKIAVSVIREKMAVAETTRYESAMGEMRQSFVITGVMDTVTEEIWSLADAIERGIIDQTHGVFIDRKLNEKYPIPVAMNAGYIKVSSTNTFQARELKRSAGVITVNFTRENRPFNITGVLDPVSHDVLPVSEAMEKGIYNKEQRKYINAENGEEMTVEDAIDCGAVLVEYDTEHKESKPEITTKTFCITGVLDRKLKKRLTFDDAIDQNILDKDNGMFLDNSSGQKFDLVTAMKKGYIRGTVLDDPDKIDQYLASARGRSGSIDSTSSDFSRFSTD